MIIDAHVHIGKFQTLNLSNTFEKALKLADRMGVDKIFCTHLISLYYDFEEGDLEVYKAMKKYPDRILGYVTITSPRHGNRLIEHVKKYICEYGFHGLKIYSRPKAAIGGFDLVFSITDEYMYPILEMASDWKVPVLAHAKPEECDIVSSNFPNVRLIMAHAGSTQIANGNWHKAIMVAQKHPNLYLDTTSSGMDLGFVEEAVRVLGAKRIVWGSDVPLLDAWYNIEKIRSAEISEEDKNLILGENILRLAKREA